MGTNWELKGEARQNGLAWSGTDWITLSTISSPSAELVEIVWWAADSGESDGGIRLAVITDASDIATTEIVNVSNDSRTVDKVRPGAVTNFGAAARNTSFYLDHFRSFAP